MRFDDEFLKKIRLVVCQKEFQNWSLSSEF